MKYAVLPASWLALAATISWTARWPRVEVGFPVVIPPLQPFPTDGVLRTLAFGALEIVLLFAILRPRTYQQSWTRALLAYAVSCAFFAFGLRNINQIAVGQFDMFRKWTLN